MLETGTTAARARHVTRRAPVADNRVRHGARSASRRTRVRDARTEARADVSATGRTARHGSGRADVRSVAALRADGAAGRVPEQRRHAANVHVSNEDTREGAFNVAI